MDVTIQYFENLKAQLKAEEERQVALVKERVLREIQPKYDEIEQMAAEELNNLQNNYIAKKNSATEQYNAQLVALQQGFENKKKEVVAATQKRKEDLLKATLEAQTYEITKQFERGVFDLDNLIKKRIEKE
jgi:hypothetical protein